MNAWEGQVLAIAVKELLEAVKTLRLGGDKRELSKLIRDLLSADPNVARSQALLDALEARSGGKPSPDLFVAKRLLAAVRKQRLLEEEDAAARKGTSLKPPQRPGPIPGAGARRRCRPKSSGSVTLLPPRGFDSPPRRRLRPRGTRNPDRDGPRRFFSLSRRESVGVRARPAPTHLKGPGPRAWFTTIRM